MKPLAALSLVLLLAVGAIGAELPETTVGMSKRLSDLVLPGSKLEVKPIEDRKTPIIMRILQARPEGDKAFRYEIDFFGLEPGTHELKNYLWRADGTSTNDLPSILVKVTPVLPAGQVQPNKLSIDRTTGLGGYRLLIGVGIVVWVIGLLVIVASFIWPRQRQSATDSSATPVTLADKLRPLVEGAMTGKLNKSELSQLERNLLAFWRKRLHLESESPELAIATLRNHVEAGPLLQQLEDWLHKPNPSQNVNVEALLKPYQQMAPEAMKAT